MGPRAAPLLPLLLALLGHPDPGRAEGCDLQLLTAEAPITLSYATSTVPQGCISSGSMHTGHEVHILSVEWSKVSAFPLNVSVVPPAHGCKRSPVLILLCARCSATITSPCSNLLVRTDAHLGPGTTATLGPELPMATRQGQLLTWAEEFYRGITSYSKLRDPRWVQLLLGEDASSPQRCILQEHFDARLHLEAEVIFYGVKGCSHGNAPRTSTTHIIHLQPEPRSTITEVNVSMNCPDSPASKQFLILQSQANLTWFISIRNCHVQFLTSGNYKIAEVPHVLIAGERLPDTEQGLVAKGLEKNCSFIASYSAIPTSARISLELQEHQATTRVPVTSTPLVHPTDMPHRLLHMLNPWKCTDETMEIVIARSHLEPIKDVVSITLRDIRCQAEKNATHFMLKIPLSHCGTSLEGQGHANNELILSLAKGAVLQSVRVAFQCNISSVLFLRLFPTAAFEAPQTELEVNKEAFVQVSTQWENHLADLQLKECSLVVPGQEPVLLLRGGEAQGVGVAMLEGPLSSHGRKVWRFRFTYAIAEGGRVPFSATLQCKAGLQVSNTTIFNGVLEVTVKDGWWPPNNRGLGLAAVLGITFGAFLIGALLTAGLWCIYSRTRPTSKLQPVSSTAPASESSSTNHSIGSTQSTPCSTSSMA